MGDTVKVGIVGCGNICDIYFKNISEVFRVLEVAACADLIPEKAEEAAERWNVKALTLDNLLASDEIDVVLNITPPIAHAQVALAAIEAGKNVYNEKPLCIERDDAGGLLEAAEKAGLRVGCAPDTFLGAGLQTCRKLVDDGWIGEPVAATAFMMSHGTESWHPNPDFFYKNGAGPLFDMGPYYLTTLVSLLGPVARVTSSARISFPERTITSKPHYGEKIQVEVPTHVAAVLDFESGAVATLVTSFDVWGANLPHIELYGSEGSLSVPDPNTFDGPVRVLRAGGEWADVPLTHPYAKNSRGVGLADMAYSLISGRDHRASGERAYHVLDVMHSIIEASELGRHVEIASTCKRPAALPLGLMEGTLDP